MWSVNHATPVWQKNPGYDDFSLYPVTRRKFFEFRPINSFFEREDTLDEMKRSKQSSPQDMHLKSSTCHKFERHPVLNCRTHLIQWTTAPKFAKARKVD